MDCVNSRLKTWIQYVFQFLQVLVILEILFDFCIDLTKNMTSGRLIVIVIYTLNFV